MSNESIYYNYGFSHIQEKLWMRIIKLWIVKGG